MTTYILPFEKMHGLGNDFILLEKRHLPQEINESKLAIYLCNRNYGIGADGLIIVDYPNDKDVDFLWHYYNSNGGEAEMCGNGMRCFAKYVYERGLIDETSFTVLTKAGIIKPVLEPDQTITVNMGVPKLKEKLIEQLTIDSEIINYTYVDIGNPHCVIFVKKIPDDSYFYLNAPKIEKHKIFPAGVNVEFVQVVNKDELNARVWERDCGPTLACGTGACAALVAAVANKYSNSYVSVNLPGGLLKINWDVNSREVFLNGPASSVFVGQFNLDVSLFQRQISITK